MIRRTAHNLPVVNLPSCCAVALRTKRGRGSQAPEPMVTTKFVLGAPGHCICDSGTQLIYR